jgi:hypothetical protein
MLDDLQSLGSSSSHSIKRLVILHEDNLNQEFIQQFIHAIESQKEIVSCDFFPAHSSPSEIIAALKQPNTLLIGYHLSHPISKKFVIESDSSITVGEHFEKRRSVDYWIADDMTQMIQLLNTKHFPLTPQIILYEKEYIPQESEKILDKTIAIQINAQDIEGTFKQFMATPQRSLQFQKVFPKMVYMNQPRACPSSVLCLSSFETLSKVHIALNQWGGGKTLLLSSHVVLKDTIPENTPLKGVIFSTHPFDLRPHYEPKGAIAIDLVALAQRLDRFHHEPYYVYHGEKGAYALYDQQLTYHRWWTRYADEISGAQNMKSF